MSVFSVEFGGVRSGGFVGFIDAMGYAAEAAFMPYAGHPADQPGVDELHVALVRDCLRMARL
jgi:hypothetical protein